MLAGSAPTELIAEAARESDTSSWLRWILECLPEDVRPPDLVETLGSVEQVKHTFRLRMLLPPRFGSQHLFGQVFRLPASHALLFTAGIVLPSPSFLRLRYPDTAHRYLKWWGGSFTSFGQESRERALPAAAEHQPVG